MEYPGSFPHQKNTSGMNEIIMCFLMWLYLVCEEDLEIVMAKDVHTILKHLNLNPEFTTYICFPKCDALYPLETEQTRCLYQTTSQAAVLTHDITGCLSPKIFKNGYLGFFLYLKLKNQLKTGPTKYAKTDRTHFLKLNFSLFVGWFNPFGNKVAGRQASFGVLALTCLDMPPHLRHQTHHLFLAGIIPGPKEPDMITMSNILKPLVDELLLLNDGVQMSSFKFPNGQKVAGFASHAATKFCSYCFCPKQELSQLCVGKLRVGRATISQSLRWKEASTLASLPNLMGLQHQS
ncbi:hypothetical protein VP01_999g1 [Puccinia sorghi]|uniref:Uncharacterized protein n=1 Tax=Puccinia sorghi TaxID=27349 RepID=A0A0L6U775_9BASI|nr:hypothetical protein VP01_999g1 [Puccinia sorghi]